MASRVTKSTKKNQEILDLRTENAWLKKLVDKLNLAIQKLKEELDATSDRH